MKSECLRAKRRRGVGRRFTGNILCAISVPRAYRAARIQIRWTDLADRLSGSSDTSFRVGSPSSTSRGTPEPKKATALKKSESQTSSPPKSTSAQKISLEPKRIPKPEKRPNVQQQEATAKPIKSRFELKAKTQRDEDAFDPIALRNVTHPSGFTGTVSNLVKGALGGGILSTHVAYMKGGAVMASVTNIALGVYITYCYWLLASSARVLYKRTHTSRMTYSDVGEAAFAIFPNQKVARFAKPFRYIVDAMVAVDLFGSCCAYQLIVAKTVKQLVENTQDTFMEPAHPGYPGLRVYLAALIVPFMLICLLRHLQWLAPLSLVADCMIVFCIGVTMYYAMQLNPKFENLVQFRSVSKSFEYVGLIVFSMSCIGVILPAENNIENPKLYPAALFTAMVLVVILVFLSGLFGYVAYLDKSESPITVNYPITLLPKILKGCMAFMIFVTHALNFWVPFELCFYYIEGCIQNKDRVVCYDLLCRALFCLIISIIAIIFPSIHGIMGFLGCFCLANLIFIFPNLIHLLVIWERPGLGKCKWRLIQWFVITGIGLVLFAAGSYVNGVELLHSITAT